MQHIKKYGAYFINKCAYSKEMAPKFLSSHLHEFHLGFATVLPK